MVLRRRDGCYDDETCPSRYDDDNDDDGREGRVPMFDRMKKKISGMEQDLFITLRAATEYAQY